MLLALTLALALGCQPTDGPTFGTGGKSGSTSDDDDDDSGGGGPGIPEITCVDPAYTNYPNIGDVIEVTVCYEDSDDDVNGGTVHLDIGLQGDELESFTLNIDGSQAQIKEGDVFFALQDVDTSEAYDMEIFLTDSSGNDSNTESATVGD